MEAKSSILEIITDQFIVIHENINWDEAPRGMPSGSKAKLINGNPKIAGLFTLRHKITGNWKVMPHFHPADEYITVLEGSCYLGIGETFEERTATKMTPGSFSVIMAGVIHYFFTKEPCTIQVQGIGPQKITYINPSDDPRNRMVV
jgi:hypothetical protein